MKNFKIFVLIVLLKILFNLAIKVDIANNILSKNRKLKKIGWSSGALLMYKK